MMELTTCLPSITHQVYILEKVQADHSLLACLEIDHFAEEIEEIICIC